MCGIFGFTGISSWKTSILLQSLCITDEVRGKHSTGLVIQSGGACFIQKKALRGKEFVFKGYTDFLFERMYSLTLGHNRYATTGAITDRNTHPFGVRIANGWNFGVHNGIVGGKPPHPVLENVTFDGGLSGCGGKDRIAERHDVPESDVDSEIVFRVIAKMQNRGMNVIDAIEEITDFISLDVDFAFAYLDTKERAIYLWRSPERPLAIFDARRLGLGRWFCSTKEIFATAWNNLRGALGDIRNVNYFEAVPYRLYRVADDGVYEVEPVKDLRHNIRRMEESFDRYYDSSNEDYYGLFFA